MGLIQSSRFGRLLGSVKKQFQRLASKLSYDFWDELTTNEIATARNPGDAAVTWYRKTYQNNPDKWVKKRLMQPGCLYLFDYETPKYADTLDFWDKNPLVLCLTPFITKDEKIRILGINLHLLPPKIRHLVIYQVFLMYKGAYTSQLFSDKGSTQVNVRWQDVKKQLDKFACSFALRMYIPSLQKNIVEFNQEDWKYAAYIPSAAYSKTNVADLEKRWKEYVKKQGKKSNTAGESHLR